MFDSLMLHKMLSGAMVSISVFDTDDIGSSPVSTTNVGFSLTGKVPHCECGEQGSNPGVNHVKIMRLGVRVTCSPSS